MIDSMSNHSFPFCFSLQESPQKITNHRSSIIWFSKDFTLDTRLDKILCIYRGLGPAQWDPRLSTLLASFVWSLKYKPGIRHEVWAMQTKGHYRSVGNLYSLSSFWFSFFMIVHFNCIFWSVQTLLESSSNLCRGKSLWTWFCIILILTWPPHWQISGIPVVCRWCCQCCAATCLIGGSTDQKATRRRPTPAVPVLPLNTWTLCWETF